MSYRNIHQAIVDKLETATKLEEVSYSWKDPTGFPFAVVQNSTNRNDYANTKKDTRTYSFSVLIYYLVQDTSEMEGATKAVEEAMDEVMDLFTRNSLTGVADVVKPLPSTLIYTDASDEAIYLIGEIIVEAVKFATC